MPSSRMENVAPIMFLAEELRPNSILDVGPGYGKYGMLMRERIDDFQGNVRIDAVEIFCPYNRRASEASSHPARGDLYATLYDSYQYGDFLSMADRWAEEDHGPLAEGADPHLGPEAIRVYSAPRAEGYDLVLLIGVLEHWKDEDASRVLQRAVEMGRHVIIETPLNYPQGSSHGNIYEAHLSEWPHDRLVGWARDHGAQWQPHTRRPRGPDDTVIGVMRGKPAR